MKFYITISSKLIHAFKKFTYMPPHNFQSPRNIGSPTTSQLIPSFKFENVKEPIPTPTKL
jgi:hypothetical protein